MGELHYTTYNKLYDRIKKDDGWFEPIIVMCKKLYEREPCGGSLHNVLDDENIEDHSIDWCAGCACGEKDELASDIANLMRAMTIEQRKRVVTSYDQYAQ